MKIYHVDPIGYYGTSGWIVIADSPERAIQLVIERETHISDKMRSKLIAYEFLGEDSTKEFVSQEFTW